MDKDKMINFILDNESVDDIKNYFKAYYNQMQKAKDYILDNFYDAEAKEWRDQYMQQVYYILDFNNGEIK